MDDCADVGVGVLGMKGWEYRYHERRNDQIRRDLD